MTSDNSKLMEYADILAAFIKGQTVVIHTSNGTILLNKKYNTTVDDLQAHYKQAYETRVITV